MMLPALLLLTILAQMEFPISEAAIAAGSLVVGSLLTKVFEFLRQRYKDEVEVDKARQAQIIAGYQLTISRLDDRITTLEHEVTTVRLEHVTCIQEQTALKVQIAKLEERIATLQPIPDSPYEK